MILRSLGLAFLLLCWLGIYGLCRELAARKQIHSDWRISWLFACAGWGALLAFVVELCSSRKMLNAPTLIAAWMTGSVILCGTAGWLAWRRGALGKGRLISWRERTVLDWGQNWPLDAKLMLVASAVLVLGQGVIALCTPTTNWDSLVYHLPRVMHWIQQQSVEHYPTANTCQLEFAPWPAFVITHLHLLQGNDRLDNLVQWFAMLTCVVVTSFIAQQLVADRHTETTSNQAHLAPASVQRRITALTCLLVTTLPIGLVESITTQTDYVVTCWFACLTCMAIALWNDPANIWYALGAGLALALGVFSKATMVIYAAPIGLAISIGALVRLPNNRLRLRLALVLVIAFLAINTPHLMRNHAVFGSALASKEILFVERNKTISLAGTCSNLIRNLVLESNSGIVPLTIWVNNCLLWLHTLTGKDLNDPDTTFPSGRFFTPRGFFLYDSTAGSFYHLLAICTAGMLALRNRKKNLVLLVYALTIGSGFLLFCMFLRWQQWHSRIHLAWLVLLAPWVSVVLTTKAPRWSCHTAGAVVWVFAIYCIFNNSSRPFLERGWFEQPR